MTRTRSGIVCLTHAMRVSFPLERSRIRRRELESKRLCRAKVASKQLYPKAIAAGRCLFI